jgi:hypothetical protein
MNVTFQIYTHHSTGNDRPAAELISRLIQEAMGQQDETNGRSQ